MQVSIPRKAIDELMEKYDCTSEEASKAYLTAQDMANESFVEAIEGVLGSKKKVTKKKIKCYTPKEIKTHLDKYVIGQEEYKKRICIAASYHFAMIQYLRQLRRKNLYINSMNIAQRGNLAENLLQ